LWTLAEEHNQQDPTFRTLLSYTRLTAAEALKQLRGQGFLEDQLPSPSTMAEILNRNGYRLRKVLKVESQIPSQCWRAESFLRWSMDIYSRDPLVAETTGSVISKQILVECS